MPGLLITVEKQRLGIRAQLLERQEIVEAADDIVRVRADNLSADCEKAAGSPSRMSSARPSGVVVV